jgi:hypothetical protein
MATAAMGVPLTKAAMEAMMDAAKEEATPMGMVLGGWEWGLHCHARREVMQ